MGPAILARAGHRPLRGQDPRLGARVHGQAAPALRALRRGGHRGGRRRAGRLPPHRRVALGGAPGRPGPAREDPSRPARRGRRRSSGRRRRAARTPLVVFVGKLIVSKGVDLLLAAWPLVRAGHPGARLQLVGFGEYEEGARRLLAALERGDLDDAREVARLGRGLEGGEEEPLPILSAFLADPPPGYVGGGPGRRPARSSSSAGSSTTRWRSCCPRADALVMPSTFPEAFGMVAVEAAACGALPVSAAHSGMLEVSRQLAAGAAGGRRRADLLRRRGGRRRGDRRAPRPLARPAGGASARPPARRWSRPTRRLWSWEGVARGVIAASRGELDRLPLA